jgi:hypothetical protein
MAAKRYDLTFDTGKPKTVTVKPVHQVRTERALAGRDTPPGPQETVFHWLWFAYTGKPVLVVDEFNAFLENLVDWDAVKSGADADPPVLSPSDSPG